MQKKHLYNFITSILISSFVLMPYFGAVNTAKAQSVAGYATGLASTIYTLPQCGVGKTVNSGIEYLFNGIGDLLSSTPSADADGIRNDGVVDQAAKEEMEKNFLKNYAGKIPDGKAVLNKAEEAVLNTKVSQFVALNDSINVSLKGTAEGGAIIDTNNRTKNIEKNIKSIDDNSTCIQSIGRLIIKMLLQKLTVSTVNWINSGFDGSPAFVQDPGKFFEDIAKNEILQFGLEINDPALFPFGKEWMKNTASGFNNKFADNAQYSLDKMIQQTNPEYSAATFQADFGQGGWDAWSAMVQNPANNPMGFKIMADNEIQKRLEGTTQSVAKNTRDALQAANGFLGDQRCADPAGTTKQQDYDAKVAAVKDGNGGIKGVCNRWEYVTPGKLISEAATTAINYQNNAYLNVTDLNDAVAAITDALLSQFSSSIMEKGFSNMSEQGADGSLVFNSSKRISSGNQTGKDFTPEQLSSSWLQANPNFDIRTDLTQALIDEQRTYSDKLALQNKELNSTTDGKNYKMDDNPKSETYGQSNAYGLMPAIWQLDYCIPGPHPGWEDDSQRILDKVTNLMGNETQESVKDKTKEVLINTAKTLGPLAGAAVGASIGTAAFPILGTIIGAAAGFIVSLAIDMFSDDSLDKLMGFYATQIEVLTGLRSNPDPSNDQSNNLTSKQNATQVINMILGRYAERINLFYNKKLLPSVASEAAINFNQLTGYWQMIKDNENKITLLKSTVNTLGDIKNKIDELNIAYPDKGDTYESKLKVQIDAFGRLSSEMVNGDDISIADSLLKQIIAKKTQIYDKLLKGPYGCEKDLENQLPNGPFHKNIYHNLRMDYLFPIIYDYNKMEKGSILPDPWNSGFIGEKDGNKMTFNTKPWYRQNNNTELTEYGPSFLGFIYYQTSNSDDRAFFCGADFPNPDWCMIEVRDLLPLSDNHSTVGKTNIDWWKSGSFETMIGIY